jgi:hypothetical protein
VTGYKSVALSGSMGDVKIKVVGRNLTTLIRRLNSLPIGPQANCMESLNGFSVDITLRNGAHVQVYNGFCAGPSDAVLSLAGHVNETRYTLYDRSCALIKDVVALFGSASVAGTRAALHTCETWTKNG